MGSDLSEYSLASACAAAAGGETARWVGDFLASRGGHNVVLAAALAQRPHSWFGPLRIPLEQLERLAGPESDATCRIDPTEWTHEVDAMAASLERGWTAPPLLAELRDGHLLIQDGNHRYEALVREGEAAAWVIVWCDDEGEAEAFGTMLQA